MKTTTATLIKQQSLATFIKQESTNPDYSAGSFTQIILEGLNDIEIDLEGIMAKEFMQGLPSDIDGSDV